MRIGIEHARALSYYGANTRAAPSADSESTQIPNIGRVCRYFSITILLLLLIDTISKRVFLHRYGEGVQNTVTDVIRNKKQASWKANPKCVVGMD